MIILRLQGLPWSATAKDIRQFFEGLSIPDGGVHIIGGEDGDVFIAFATDEDARKAMQRQKLPLNGSRIILMLSSKSEMQEVIAESRAAAQSRKVDPFGTSSSSVSMLTTTPRTDLQGSHRKEGAESSSHYQQFSQNEHRRGPLGYQSATQQGRNMTSQSYDSPGYGSAYPLSRDSQGMGIDQSEGRRYTDDYLDKHSSGRDEPRSDEVMYGQGRNISRLDDPDKYQRESRGRQDQEQARPPPGRDYDYQAEPSQYSGASQFGAPLDQKTGDFGDRRFRPDDVGRDSHPWPSDIDRPFSQRRDGGRTLMPPSESRSGYRNSPENEDPMDGISMSYPPPGPSDKFGYSQVSDKDQRKSEIFPPRGFDAGQPGDSGRINTGYRRQDAYDSNNEREAETYNQKQFGEESWIVDPTSSKALSQPARRREPADFQPYHRDENQTTGKQDDFFDPRKEMNNQPNQNRGGFPVNTFPPESSSQGYGSYPTSDSQPIDMPPDHNRNPSIGYPDYPNDRFKKENSEFENRTGNMPPMQPEDLPPSSMSSNVPSLMETDVAPMMMYGSKDPNEMPPVVIQASNPTFLAVRLSGLPYTCTEREIVDFLHGIKIVPRGIHIIFDKQGKMTGTANVKLDGPQDMQEALRRDKNYIGRRYIDVTACPQWEWDKHVQPIEESPKRERSRSPVRGSRSPIRVSNTCVEVKGLSTYIKEADIINFFEGLEIKSKGIFFDYSKDGSSLSAYVEFCGSDHSRKACQKNGTNLGRRSISVRIISKEIVEAKRNLKKRSDRRSPGRRSPDRRRSNSPYSRRGRSPGRRGRSSPNRGSSRSSPRRNGPGRRGESPSRRESRDRESSRTGRKGQSPSRHVSQDRKVGQSDRKERKDGETKEGTATKSSGRSEERKDRQSPRPQNKSDDSRQTSSRSLLPDPDSKPPTNQRKGDLGRGIVKSDLPATRKPEDFIKNLSDPMHGGADFKRGGSVKDVQMKDEREAECDGQRFHGTRERKSRFEASGPNWQQQKPEPREEPESMVPPADNRQIGGLLDIRQGLVGDHSGAEYNQFKDDQEERGRGQLIDRNRGIMEDRWSGPMDNRLVGVGGGRPVDDRQGPVDDTQHTPSGEREVIPPNWQRGPPEGKRGLLDDPRTPAMDAGHDGFRNRSDFPIDDRRPPPPDDWQGNEINPSRRGFSANRQRDQMGFGHDPPPTMDNRERPYHRQDGPLSHSAGLFHEGQSDGRPPLFDNRRGGPFSGSEENRRGFTDNREEDAFAGDTRERILEQRGRGQFEQMPGLRDDRELNVMNRGDREKMANQQHERPLLRGFGHEPPPGDRGHFQHEDTQFPMERNMRHVRDQKGPPLDIDNMRMDTEHRDRDPPGPMHMHGGPQDKDDTRPMDFGPPQKGGMGHGDMKLSEDQGGKMPPGMEEYCCAHVRNVPYSARWPEIAQFFRGLQIVPGGIHIMVGHEGKPSGHCFVEFSDCHQARMSEGRRLQPLRDRPLQINACSKKMMIRALEQGGELQQNSRMNRMANQPHPRGPGPQFRPTGPGGPEFRQGGPGFRPHGPFPGPRGPNFGPRGPLQGAPLRPRFEVSQGSGDHPQLQHSQNLRPSEKPRDEGSPMSPQPLMESSKSEKPSTEHDVTKKEPVKTKSEQEKQKEILPKTVATSTPVHRENHKGCVVSATNLPLTITVDAILDFFKGFNTIEGAVKLDTNEATGKATGEAKIVFSSSTEANRAIKERNNRPLNGRIVRLHVV